MQSYFKLPHPVPHLKLSIQNAAYKPCLMQHLPHACTILTSVNIEE